MRFLAVTFLVLTSMFSYAQEVEVNNAVEKNIQDLLLQNKPVEAYNLADANGQLLGEPKFDFLLGLAALKINKVHESVFAFERVVVSAPRWYEARILLATAYLKASNIVASSAEISSLKSETLSSSQLQKVKSIEQKIKNIESAQNGILKNSVGISLGQDSNINAGTSEDSIFIPALNNEIPLSEESKEYSGHYWRLSYDGSYKKKVSQQQSFRITWGLNDYQYANEAQYNRTIATIAGEYRFNRGLTTYVGKGSFTPLLLKGDLYRSEALATFGVEHKISKQFVFSGSMGLGEQNNNKIENLDIKLQKLNLAATYIGGSSMHKVGLFHINEKANLDTGKHNAKDSTGLNYQMIYAINDSALYLAMLSVQKQSFDDIHPLFLMQRKETLRQFTNTVQYNITDKLNIAGLVSYQNKSSNLDLYKYDRLDLALTLKYQF